MTTEIRNTEFKKPIPVTILTGFLGSGKTSLLNNILKNKQWYKIAVIENEYGEESIDTQLIQQDVEELIEIKDGCMCCIVRWDLIKWVQKILDSGKDIDYIIIEASGMSEPLPVAETFMVENFGWATRLDSIIWVVDAQNFHNNIVQSLKTTFEQIESAHFIILNKVEGITPEKLTETHAAIRKINPHSSIIESNYCDVDMNYILDTDLFQEDVPISSKKDTHEHHHDHNKYWHSHDKKQMEKYFFKTQQRCYSIENMKHFLSEISQDVFRMKWFIHFKDYPGERYILQKAGACFTLWKDEHWDGAGDESKLVFIGKNIDQQLLHDILLKEVFFM